MQENTASTASMRTFDRKKLLMMSVGSFVGSGLVSILGVAAGVTGYSVWLAFLLAIVIGFLSALPYVLMSSVMTFNGGTYTIACTFMGNTFGGAYILSTFVNGIAISLMAAAFGGYVQSVFPGANIKMFAVGILLVFWLINCLGVNVMATVQKYSTYLLLAALAVFSIVNYTHLNPATFDFSGPQFMVGGMEGFLGAMSMLVFSCQAYDLNVYTFGKYTINPRKNVPWAMFATMGLLILVYCGVSIAAVGGVNLETFAGKPLTDVARATLPTFAFYIFIILGPILCLTTTINGCIANFTVALEKATEDGWFARGFASKNRYGASWKIMTAIVIVCVLPVIMSVDISVLTKNTVMLGSFLQIPLLFALWNLPKKFPEAFANNTLKMSTSVYYAGMVIAIIARLIILFWSANGLNAVNVIGSVVAVAVCFAFSFLRSKSGKTTVVNSYDFD